MHRLTVGVKDIIGNIDDVVDRTYTDQTQLVLQPFGTFLYGHVLDGNACVAGTCFCVLNNNINVHIVVVYLEGIYRRTLQCSLTTVLNKPCIQVARYTVV